MSIFGFPELEWFDSVPEQMMNHFRFQQTRDDRDIIDIDRFFENVDPGHADPADFYSDEAQILWCSVDCYLRILRAFEIRQNFVCSEKLAAFARPHLRDLSAPLN
jgi:hypothetical protein